MKYEEIKQRKNIIFANKQVPGTMNDTRKISQPDSSAGIIFLLAQGNANVKCKLGN